MGTFQAIIKLLRPKQWLKNIFVFIPLLFTAKFLNSHDIFLSLVAFGYFCLAASASYVVNDICDLETDQQISVKRKKHPLANGDLSIGQAVIVLCLLYTIMLTGFLIIPYVMLIIMIYLVMNYAYSFKLKSVPVVDIFIIAIGFVLRVLVGSVVINVPLSPWVFVTTLSLALFLASLKREQDIFLGVEAGVKSAFKKYNEKILTKFSDAAAASTIVFYSISVIFSKLLLVVTIPVMLFGIFRYWYIVEMHKMDESPTDVLLKDWLMLVAVLIWVGISVYAMFPG